MVKHYFVRSIKFLIRPFYNALNFLWDARLESNLVVRESGKEIFKVLDYGKLVRLMASTFEIKEPETLNWIKGFDPKDN